MDQIEGRNPVLECMVRHRREVHTIWLDRGAKPEPRLKKIVSLANERSIPLHFVERRNLERRAQGRVHNGVIAQVDPISTWTAKQFAEQCLFSQEDPLVVMADELSYEHNLGAILRSCLGFGATGLVLPSRRGAGLSSVVQRVSMGAAEEVPIVRESLFAALKHLKRAGCKVVGADMGGVPLGQAKLSGPLVLVMGAEGRGLSSKLRERCDQIVSIPLKGQLESLNVSVAAALLMYEKRRQDGWYDAE